MHPIPCAHCGSNFMRPLPDPQAPKLCNNCLIREEKKNPQKKEPMEPSIDIKITCPINIHHEIEEHCINQGINLTKYFLGLHHFFSEHSEGFNKVNLTDVYIDPKPSGKPDFVVTKKEMEEKPKQPQPKEKKK